MNKIEKLKKWADENVEELGVDVIKVVDSQIKLWGAPKPKKEKSLQSIKEVIQNTLNESIIKQSKAEHVLAEALLKAGLPFQQQYPISTYTKPDGGMGARYYLDFLISESLNVEIDGEVWHDKERDDIRDCYLRKMGYKTIRFPASQVYFDVESIVEEIEGELKT